MYQCKSSVLIIIFNRPNETRKVFDIVRQVKPPKLFIAADAPRAGKVGEAKLCANALEIFNEIDWPCKLYTKINSENLGSYLSIPNAIDWFFKSEEMGIVLEDDCVPNASFFRFCDNVLCDLKDEEDVMWINGSNAGFLSSNSSLVYCNSIYPCSWGWASWARAWALFDGDKRKKYAKDMLSRILWDRVGKNFLARMYWRYTFEYAYRINNWDFRWTYTMWSNGGRACSPSVNMISNVGYGVESMHGGGRHDSRGFAHVADMRFPLHYEKGADFSLNIDRHMEKVFYKISVYTVIRVFIAAKCPFVRTFVRKMRRKAI